jgi:hypothetical protein
VTSNYSPKVSLSSMRINVLRRMYRCWRHLSVPVLGIWVYEKI